MKAFAGFASVGPLAALLSNVVARAEAAKVAHASATRSARSATEGHRVERLAARKAQP